MVWPNCLRLAAHSVASSIARCARPMQVAATCSRVLPSQSLAVYTDRKGRFRFGTVPGEPRTKHLIVRARGHVETVTVTMPPNEGEPVVIHIDLFELKEG